MKTMRKIILFLVCILLSAPLLSACGQTVALNIPTLNGVYAYQGVSSVVFVKADNAESYIITINGTEHSAINSPYVATALLSDNIIYEITIRAVTSKVGYTDSADSAIYYYDNRLTLDSPIPSYNAGILSWDAVDGANLYTVWVNGVTFITNLYSIDINSDSNFTQIAMSESGYTVKVKANSTAEYKASDYSAEVVIPMVD